MELEFFIVAPEIPDLIEVEDELNFITDRFASYPQPPLRGIVTASDIEHETQRHHADVLFIASHNEQNGGIVVSDGHIAEDEIAAWVKQLGASLLILSVCNGATIAKRVHRATGCNVLFCRVDVADREAMLYTARFVNALARCDSYKEAYAFAGNAHGRFVLLESKMMQGALSELTQQIKNLNTEVVNLRVEMASLKVEMNNLKEKNTVLPVAAESIPIWEIRVYALIMGVVAVGIFFILLRGGQW